MAEGTRNKKTHTTCAQPRPVHTRAMRNHPGQNIRALREALQLRQHDVAAKSGVSVNLISRYETRKGEPTLKTARKLAKALRCSIVDILGDA